MLQLPTFLLNLHVVLTLSVRFAATFTPDLCPSDALGVQAPFRGSLRNVMLFFFHAALLGI